MDKLIIWLAGVGLSLMVIGIAIQLLMEKDTLLAIGFFLFALGILPVRGQVEQSTAEEIT